MRRPAQTAGKKRSNMERDVEDTEALAAQTQKKKKLKEITYKYLNKPRKIRMI